MSIVTLSQAVDLLRQNDIVALPTETVYGLAGRIDSEKALRQIFSVKERPFFDPLIVHVATTEQARALSAEWPPIYDLLAQRFWPGPLTLIAKKTTAVNPLITSGLDTVAVRCPQHPLALEVLRALGIPLAAPSANRFGHTSPTSAQHVETEFGAGVPVLDGGICSVGVESTVLQADQDVTGWKLTVLRPGGISRQDLRDALSEAGVKFSLTRESSVRSPGSLKAHYQPVSPLILLENKVLTPELKTAVATKLGVHFSNWTEVRLPDSPQAAARELYSELRRLSTVHTDALWITRLPHQTGENWEVVWDRIERASSLTT